MAGWLPLFAAASGFNNGRSQTNFDFIYGGDYPFINMMKNALAPAFGDNSNNSITPDIVDSDGYPTSIVHSGIYWVASTPTVASNYIVTWDGTGTIAASTPGGAQLTSKTFTGSISGTVLTVPGSITGGPFQFGEQVTGGTTLPYTFIMSQLTSTTYRVSKSQTVALSSMTADGGSVSSSGGVGAGFYAVTSTGGSFRLNISAIGSPSNRVTNVQIYEVANAALVAAGEVFHPTFKARIIEANFGVLRFLAWQLANTSNETSWMTRKPITAASYQAPLYIQNLYAGVTTNSGNAYSTAAFPAVHSSDGTAWTSGGPKNKDCIHVFFTTSATQSGTASLSVGGAGAINILNPYGGILDAAGTNGAFYPVGSNSRCVATLVYDATFNAWIKQGGDGDIGTTGISSCVPPELFFRLCKEVGAHPYIVAPTQSIEVATDYMPNLVYYGKLYAAANAPWMIPRYEPPNELWNFGGGFYQTAYAQAKAALLWSGGDLNSWYGKALANLGQICSQVYGSGLGTAYHVLCGVKTADGATGGSTLGSDERLSSSKYIAQVAAADPAQTGAWGTITFAKTAAKFVTSHVANAQYFSPTERFSIAELQHGYSYSVTNRGNSSAQLTIASNYVDTLTGSLAPYNLAYVNSAYVTWKAWAATFGVNKMCGYEGDYSPDYMAAVGGLAPNTSWLSLPTGKTQNNPAIIQLGSLSQNYESGGTPNLTGNPGVVGMAVTFTATGTSFDNPSPEAVTFAGGGSANISGSNTLKLNQAVVFVIQSGNALPNELTSCLTLTATSSATTTDPYYVVSVGNPFQISATRGGAPITFNSVGSSVTAQEAWFITNVDAVNNRVTLDVDGTSLGTPTTGYMGYCNSQTFSNNLRFAGKGAPNLQGYTYGSTSPASNYKNFIDAGGEFPSNFTMGGLSPSTSVWNLLEPIGVTPDPPQWAAIKAFNH